MMKTNVRLLTLVACSTLLAAGCAVGPNYRKPVAEVPAQYKESTAPPGSDIFAVAKPRDAESRSNWWEMFGDPNLNELEDQVNTSNQDLKAAEARFREARALARADTAGLYPTITTSPSITVTQPPATRTVAPGSTQPQSTTTIYSLPVDLNYEVDLWGRIRRTVEAGNANVQASAADLQTVRLSLEAELASDYFILRSIDAEKQLLDSTTADFEKALQLTRYRHDSGIASGVDVAQAETQLETTRAQAIDTGVERAQLEHAIALLIGRSPSEFSLPAMAIQDTPPEIPPGLPSRLLERRPDIAAAERRVAAANAQIGVAQAAFFPSLILNATGGFQATSFADWFKWPSRFWSLGPSLVQTLFEGGRRKAVSQQAWAVYDETVANYRETVLIGFQEVEDNLAALRILSEEAHVQEGAVDAAGRSLQISNSRYASGIASYLEVLTAQSVMLTNQRTAVDLQQRRMIASVLLIKALGGGWDVQDLQPPISTAPATAQKQK